MPEKCIHWMEKSSFMEKNKDFLIVTSLAIFAGLICYDYCVCADIYDQSSSTFFIYLPSLQEVYLLDISTNSIWLILKSRRKILINWTKQKTTSQRNERPYFIPQINSRFIICEKIILFLFLFQPYTVEFQTTGGKTCSFCDKKFSRGTLNWFKVWNNSI